MPNQALVKIDHVNSCVDEITLTPAWDVFHSWINDSVPVFEEKNRLKALWHVYLVLS